MRRFDESKHRRDPAGRFTKTGIAKLKKLSKVIESDRTVFAIKGLAADLTEHGTKVEPKLTKMVRRLAKVMEALSPELEAPYKPPRTVSDAEKRLRALGWEVDLKDLPSATKIAEALEGLATKYPKTALMLKKVGKLEGADSTAAQVSFPDWELSINPRFTTSNGLRKYKDTERFRFHPKNTGNVKGMMAHDWGHLITRRIMFSNLGEDFIVAMRDIAASDTAKTHGSPSIYGTTSAAELMAETFADWEVNGEDAHPLSKIMAKAILKFDQRVTETENI